MPPMARIFLTATASVVDLTEDTAGTAVATAAEPVIECAEALKESAARRMTPK